MTIITKPITEKKKLEQPLVINENDQDTESAVVPPLYVYRKRNSWVLLLTALLLLSLGIIGSFFVYRVVNHMQNRQFRGWCQVPYHSAPSYESYQNSFNEEFDIDVDSNFAKVRVPDFSGGRSGHFIHDFNANLTGIVDLEDNRCFVMPLNRKIILPPRNMIDLVTKMMNGYYQLDTKRIRNRMYVVTPPVSDLAQLGPFIAKECNGKFTYMLAQDNGKILYKRSVDETFGQFYELAGPNLQQIDVVNMAAVEEYEKSHQSDV